MDEVKKLEAQLEALVQTIAVPHISKSYFAPLPTVSKAGNLVMVSMKNAARIVRNRTKFSMSDKTLYRYAQSGLVDVIHFGRRMMIPLEEIDRLISETRLVLRVRRDKRAHLRRLGKVLTYKAKFSEKTRDSC